MNRPNYIFTKKKERTEIEGTHDDKHCNEEKQLEIHYDLQKKKSKFVHEIHNFHFEFEFELMTLFIFNSNNTQ